MTRLELYIRKSKPVVAMVSWLKTIYPPGFQGVSLYHSLNFFQKQIFSHRFNNRANAVSFSFLMALPPLLLFFFSLIPYMPLPEEKILSVLNDMLLLIAPNEGIKQSISNIIEDFINNKKSVLLSFSVILTIFYSSNGMMGLMKSFDTNVPGFKRRTPIVQRGYAILLTFLLIFVILFTITLMIFQLWAAGYFGLTFLQNSIVLKIITYLFIVGMVLVSISYIYRYGCSAIIRLRLISPGAIIATVLTILLTILFFYAVNNLVNYDKIYGSIGTLIIFMVWINLMAQIMLIGFELNASIISNKKNYEETK